MENKIYIWPIFLLMLMLVSTSENVYSATKLTKAQWREIYNASQPPSWSKSFNKAEITHEQLSYFIGSQLVPLLKKLPVRKGENRIHIMFYRDSTYNASLKNEKVNICLLSDDESCHLDMNSPETEHKTYMTEIEGITTFITDACLPDAKSNWINVSQAKRSPDLKYWKLSYAFKDKSANWIMTLMKDSINLDSIRDCGLNFLRDGTPVWKYIPIKKMAVQQSVIIPRNILEIDTDSISLTRKQTDIYGREEK